LKVQSRAMILRLQRDGRAPLWHEAPTASQDCRLRLTQLWEQDGLLWMVPGAFWTVPGDDGILSISTSFQEKFNSRILSKE
uniref:Uncharacterized protein n=1 Tax=Pristionchus pacificus TaxID=54126 RepID=A0A2A6CYJ9_PRIPA